MASLSWSDLDDLDEDEFIGVVGSGLVEGEEVEGEEVEEEQPFIPTEDNFRQIFLEDRERLRDDDKYVLPGLFHFLMEAPLLNDGGRPHTMPSFKRPFRPRASPLAQVENATPTTIPSWSDLDDLEEEEFIGVVENGLFLDEEQKTIAEELITLKQCALRAARMALDRADAVADALTCTSDDNVEEAQVFTETDDDCYSDADDFEYNNYVDEQAQRCYPGGLTAPLKYLDMDDDITVVNDDGRTHYYVSTGWTKPRASYMSTVEHAYPPSTTLAIAAVEHDSEYAVNTDTLVASEDDNDDASDSGYYSEEETTSLPLSVPAELTAIAENPALPVTPYHACEYPVYTESPVIGEEDTVYTENLVVEEEVTSFGHYFSGKLTVVLRSFQAVIDATLDLVR
ncbi:hypothetical protein MMC18_003981 [Xylographa bjoerkii]|nr:hypothetical protein [Xylographa bjoerkii]